MNKEELFQEIQKKHSFLCIGLDTDIRKIPLFLKENSEDPIFDFNKAIIDATQHLCVAYNLNLAFYEGMGSFGMKSLEKTVFYLQQNYPEHFVIADAKRSDMGSPAQQYAKSFFEHLKVDALTVSPYMGSDSVQASLQYPNKWTILLALTSNERHEDFQMMQDANGEYLYERVLRISKSWADDEQMMYVVDAAKAQMLERIRLIVPNHFLLIPGIDLEEGVLEEVAQYGLNRQCGLLVSVSERILYADDTEAFAMRASEEAERIRRQMSDLLYQHKLIDSLQTLTLD